MGDEDTPERSCGGGITLKVLLAEKYNQGEVLAEGILSSSVRDEEQGEPLWKGEEGVVIPLSGQVFELSTTESRSGYPDFPELEWVVKDRHASKVDLIKSYVEDSSEVVIATDYDREGELIGTLATMHGYGGVDYDLIRSNDVTRMRYSALTEDEVVDAYEDRSDPDEDLFWMGVARSKTDFRVGINLSKAISQCILRALGDYQVMSIGRVQTPTLQIVHRRTEEREQFDPDTYWKCRVEAKE